MIEENAKYENLVDPLYEEMFEESSSESVDEEMEILEARIWIREQELKEGKITKCMLY